ncbi:YraN family protein [Chitinophagaceae bacterium MMS25-I14]
MAKHNETGIKGEHFAEKFLLNLGYNILERNWRHGKREVDLIAAHKGELVFAEIKTRTSFDFGFPEEAVDRRKQSFLKAAAEAYFDSTPGYENIRFDIISILLKNGQPEEITHFIDAFF